MINSVEAALKGRTIQTLFGEQLGKIEEVKAVLVKWGDEDMDYHIWLISGLTGDHDKLLVLPVEAFQTDGNEVAGQPIILNVDKELLEQGPMFDKNNYPAAVDLSFLDKIYLYYGFKKYRSNHTII